MRASIIRNAFICYIHSILNSRLVFILAWSMPIVLAICAEKFLHIAPCALCLKVRKIYYFGVSIGIFSVILENKIERWKILYKILHIIPVLVAALVVAVSFVHFTIENNIQSFQFLTEYQFFQCSLDAGYEFQTEKEWMTFIQGRNFISCAQKSMIFGVSFVTLSFAYSILLLSYSITRMLVKWYR